MNVIFFLAFIATFVAIGAFIGVHYAEHRDVDADLARFLIVPRDYPNYPPTPGATPSRNPPSGVGGFPSASHRHADPTDPT